jgi:hypothetical protein
MMVQRLSFQWSEVTEKYKSGAAKKLYIVCNATHCKHVVGNYKAHHGISFVSLMRNDLFDLIKRM